MAKIDQRASLTARVVATEPRSSAVALADVGAGRVAAGVLLDPRAADPELRPQRVADLLEDLDLLEEVGDRKRGPVVRPNPPPAGSGITGSAC